MRGKALKFLIVHISGVERQRFEGKRFDPIPPPFPYPGKGGGSGGYIRQRLRRRSGEMGGSLLVTVSRRYTKTPLRFLLEAVFCVRLTAHYVVSFLFPFVKRRYRSQKYRQDDLRDFGSSGMMRFELFPLKKSRELCLFSRQRVYTLIRMRSGRKNGSVLGQSVWRI